MRWGLLLIGATVLVGSSCVYDLEPYQPTAGAGGAASSTTDVSSVSTTTTTQVSSSSGVGGGLPSGITHCKRQDQAAADEDKFDSGGSCNTLKFLWRPASPWSIDELCPPEADGVTVLTTPAPKGASKFAGATGQYTPGAARKPLVFQDCYVSLRVDDVGQLGSGVYAFAGLVTATNAGPDDSHLELRVAHKGPTTYGIYVDSGRVARVGSDITETIGNLDELVRFGESGGEYIVETKSASATEWTPLYKTAFTLPTEGDLFFAFGVYVKTLSNAGTAHFDDYNVE